MTMQCIIIFLVTCCYLTSKTQIRGHFRSEECGITCRKYSGMFQGAFLLLSIHIFHSHMSHLTATHTVLSRAQTTGVLGQFIPDSPLPRIKGEIWSGTLVGNL